MKHSISKEQAVALTNPSAFRTSLLRILKNGLILYFRRVL
nr:MAG TPA: hypothetical protein [Caudoviricetes sp.]